MATKQQASLMTSSTASVADETAAITAGYAQGRTTVYYTDCKSLPSVHSSPAATGAVDRASSPLQEGCSQQLTQLGSFSFLPHPEYAGRSGKTVNKPLFLHHLIS